MALSANAFFGDRILSRQLFNALLSRVESLGDFEMRVTKSQIAFRRRRNFALVWLPDQYLKGDLAPLVLTVLLPRRDPSPRWKEVVEPYPGRFTHHLELYDVASVDEEVHGWLQRAWRAAA